MCVHRETGAQRAVKVLRKSHMDEDEKRMLFNEINILKEIVSSRRFLLEKSRNKLYSALHYSAKPPSESKLTFLTGSPQHHQDVRVL
jgi:hypothetical protein